MSTTKCKHQSHTENTNIIMQKVILVVVYDENLRSKDEICSQSKCHIKYD